MNASVVVRSTDGRKITVPASVGHRLGLTTGRRTSPYELARALKERIHEEAGVRKD